METYIYKWMSAYLYASHYCFAYLKAYELNLWTCLGKDYVHWSLLKHELTGNDCDHYWANETIFSISQMNVCLFVYFELLHCILRGILAKVLKLCTKIWCSLIAFETCIFPGSDCDVWSLLSHLPMKQ